MTVRLVFEGLLTELSKTGAPSLLLQDFNYFFNKAISLYINKRYNIYNVNLLSTDDLRVLETAATLEAEKVNNSLLSELSADNLNLLDVSYEVELPTDYLHILNCICIYSLLKNYKCYNKGSLVSYAAKRLTADSLPIVLHDYYTRPLPQRPYYYIHNVNNNVVDQNDYSKAHLTPTNSNTDITTTYSEEIQNSNFPRTINLGDLWKGESNIVSIVNKESGLRYGNASKIRMEIRYGNDDTIFKLEKVLVGYIKTPLYIRLTLELMNLTEDTSQIMEFPDYVCQEIINELTMLVLENTANPRLLTNTTVTQSIANPAQQLTK